MSDDRTLTAKGSRRQDEVLDAAVRCLGERGYAGTSLQRVAEAAGVQKRMVLYYFGTREHLVAAALERLADRFLDDLETCVEAHADPDQLIDALVDALLAHLDDRPLIAAFHGLAAESASDPTLRDTLARMRARATIIANGAIDRFEAAGRTLSMQRELLILSATVAAQGVGLELLQHGMTPELERAIVFGRAALPLLLFE